MMPYSCHAWQKRATHHPHATLGHISPARHLLLGGALTVALVGLTGRLAYWQVAQHGPLGALAAAQQQHVVTIPALRGMILDRNGMTLALTINENAIIADPQAIQQLSAAAQARVAERLAALTGIPVTVIRPQLAVVGGYQPLTDGQGLVYHLTPDASAFAQHQIDAGALPGVTLQMQSWRAEPDGSLASQVLGFVRNGTDLGQYGVEAAADTTLAGTPGSLVAALNPDKQPLANAPQQVIPAIAGANLTLTIDANLQSMAERGLRDAVTQIGATGGTVIIEDPQTGEILAMANAPDFDPNTYGSAPLAAFQNPAIASVYDPGSTMKAMTMAMGVDLGTITPDTAIIDPGTFTVGGQTIANWNHLAWGTETMTQVLQHSANVGAAWVAVNEVGQQRFAAYLRNFGFGSPTGVNLAGEVPGLMPPQEKSAQLAQLDLAENAFGESIGVTPLQMVMAYGVLANGGLLLRPQIIHSIDNGQVTTTTPTIVRRVVNAQTAVTLTQMLVQSALHSEAAMALIPGYAVAAKTGTSTPDPQHPADTYASVIGYAPANQPRFVVLVKLDRPQSSIFGGIAAGPLWRSLVRELLAYDHIPPQEGL
jgi:cell division protein FtsI/penicillin-binding protein 2